MITPGTDLFSALKAELTENASVICTEVRSKKGVEGGIPRVLRVQKNGDATEILFAFFQCAPDLDAEVK